jgi:hypothetical protein
MIPESYVKKLVEESNGEQFIAIKIKDQHGTTYGFVLPYNSEEPFDQKILDYIRGKRFAGKDISVVYKGNDGQRARESVQDTSHGIETIIWKLVGD